MEIAHKDDPAALEHILRFLLLAFELAEKNYQVDKQAKDNRKIPLDKH